MLVTWTAGAGVGWWQLPYPGAVSDIRVTNGYLDVSLSLLKVLTDLTVARLPAVWTALRLRDVTSW